MLISDERRGPECKKAEMTLQDELFMSVLEVKLRGVKHRRDLMNLCLSRAELRGNEFPTDTHLS